MTVNGTGTGSIGSVPSGISCSLGGMTGGSDCSEVWVYGTSVTLTPVTPIGTTFNGWTGGPCDGMNGPCAFTVTADVSMTASFTLQQRTLTVTKGGTGTGTVTSNPAGISCGATCGSDNADFDYGQMVTLTAAPDATSNFTGWSGGGCGGVVMSQCTVTMTQARNVTANFTLKSYTLTVATNGGDGVGDVFSDDGGIDCGTDCSDSYTHGNDVLLSASPDFGYVFTGWSGGGCETAGLDDCVVSMTAATNVTAAFQPDDFPVDVDFTGTGSGSVTHEGTGTICSSPTPCSEDAPFGSTVTLTATPSAGSVFLGWSGDCTGLGSCVLPIDGPQSVTARFQDIVTITVKLQGEIGGEEVGGAAKVFVVSTGGLGGSISCSQDGGCSANFVEGVNVTLSPVQPGWAAFEGWQTGPCAGSTSPCVAPAAEGTIEALFSRKGNIVFVSSATRTGDLGGLGGADEFCATLANRVRLPGVYQALIAEPGINIFERLDSRAEPFIRMDGEIVARTLGEWVRGNMEHPVFYNEFGDRVATPFEVWTGAFEDGTPDSVLNTCDHWTKASGVLGRRGHMAGQAYSWVDRSGTVDCSVLQRVYCISDDAVVSNTPEVPKQPYVFLSQNTFRPSEGTLTDADDICDAEGGDLVSGGRFIAYLGTESAPANSRIPGELLDATYRRPDGVPVGTPEELFGGKNATGFLSSAINMHANMSYDYLATIYMGSGVPRAWTGMGNGPDKEAVSACGGGIWNSSLGGSTTGDVGNADLVYQWADAGVWGCTRPLPLYCIQIALGDGP